MRSQFVGVGIFGKFAAGNVFAGEYLETQGTDGILGWGREWTSRPVALKGYARYERGSQKYNGTKKTRALPTTLASSTLPLWTTPPNPTEARHLPR